MFFDYRYAYLIGNIILCFPLWLMLFYYRKDLRKEILITSGIGSIAGVLSELLYTRDYWKPVLFNGWEVGLEDALFGFFIAGIASSVYEVCTGNKFSRRDLSYRKILIRGIPFMFFVIFFLPFLTLRLEINSIYASMLVLLMMSIYIVVKRKDLFMNSIVSGVLVCLFAFFAYSLLFILYPALIDEWWVTQNITNIRLYKVPLEELLWAFTLGMFLGPFFEYIAKLKLVKNNYFKSK